MPSPPSDFEWVRQPVKWIPLPYMKKAVKFLLERNAAALLLDPGMRKSSITLAAIKVLIRTGAVRKVLVIAPLRPAQLTWPDEVAKWLDFCDLRMEVLHGPRKDDALAREADVYVINPEGLPWLFGVKKSKTPAGKTRVTIDAVRAKALGFDLLVLDELTRWKNPASQRFKTLKQFLPLVGRRWGLTGSPSANGLEGMFGQVYVLDGGRTFGEFVSHFRTRYCEPSHDGFGWTIREGMAEEIHGAIAPMAMRLDADDYLDLPPEITHDLTVELDADAKAVYDAVEDELFAQLDDGLLSPVNAGAASNKCRQVAGGAAYLDVPMGELPPPGPKRWAEIHATKLDALEELVDELNGQPVLVAYEYGHERERIARRFPEARELKGTGPKAAEVVAAWNKGLVPMLLVQWQNALGLNLQEANCAHLAAFTLTWDRELYEQMVFRLRRTGTTAKRIFVHRFIARGTVDHVVVAAQARKDEGQKSLFAALREHGLRRRRRK